MSGGDAGGSTSEYSLSTRYESMTDLKTIHDRLSAYLKSAESSEEQQSANVSFLDTIDEERGNRNSITAGRTSGGPANASNTFPTGSTSSVSSVAELKSDRVTVDVQSATFASSVRSHSPSAIKRPHSSLSAYSSDAPSQPHSSHYRRNNQENVRASLSVSASDQGKKKTAASVLRPAVPSCSAVDPLTPRPCHDAPLTDERVLAATTVESVAVGQKPLSAGDNNQQLRVPVASSTYVVPVDSRAAAASFSNQNGDSRTNSANAASDVSDGVALLKPRKTMLVNGTAYQILNLLGKGGSSKVYQVFDEKTEQCLAIKVVELADAEDEVRKAYENEIRLLERLQKSDRVVRLYGYERKTDEDRLYVVMEKGDTDLATFLKRRRGQEPLPDKLVAFYWLEMLKAVLVIHNEGIVHSDLKPSNFLLVGGHLKLIDFGIASTIPNNKTAITKECQMGTLSYMSPEAIKQAGSEGGAKFRIPLKSDVWSLGCILYNMVYGKTPFQQISNTYAKMLAITDERHRIPFDTSSKVDPRLLDVMKRCLQRKVEGRPSVTQLLDHPYVQSIDEHADAKKKEVSTPPRAVKAFHDSELLSIGAALADNTPRTNAKLLKRYFGGSE